MSDDIKPELGFAKIKIKKSQREESDLKKKKNVLKHVNERKDQLLQIHKGITTEFTIWWSPKTAAAVEMEAFISLFSTFLGSFLSSLIKTNL